MYFLFKNLFKLSQLDITIETYLRKTNKYEINTIMKEPII